MSDIEARLEALGLRLPAPVKLPPRGRAWTSLGARLRRPGLRFGPWALDPDGSLAHPLGKVGQDLTLEQGYAAARLTGLAMLASLKAELGELDRIVAWLRVFGMVNTAEGFNRFPLVINGFSDLIVSLFGADRGRHARSAVGMAGLPFDLPVEIEAEIAIRA